MNQDDRNKKLYDALRTQMSDIKDLRPYRKSDQIAEEIHSDLSLIREDMRDYHTKEEAEKAKDKHFQLFNSFFSAILGGVFGVLGTLFVEHFDSVSSFVSSVYSRFYEIIISFFQ